MKLIKGMKYETPIKSPEHAEFCKREAQRRYGGKIITDSLGMLLVKQADNGILHTDDVLRALSRSPYSQKERKG